MAAFLDDVLYRLVRLITRPSRTLRRRLEHSAVTGRLVELLGDVVTVEGLRFSVRSPAIAPASKAPFVYGSYESAERRLLRTHLDPSLPVVELGGSIGVVSCLVSRRLRNPSAHVVVEANAALLPLLRENRDRNRCAFTIVHAALAYGVDEVRFGSAREFTASRTALPDEERSATSGDPGVLVPARTLRQLMAESGFERCTLVCDVEGAEWAMVAQDAEMLRQSVAMLLVELHPEPGTGRAVGELAAQIERAGFREVARRGDTYVFRPRD